MASRGYWTPSDSYPPKGLKSYHIFLDETFPSSAFRGAKLANQNITSCLDFRPNDTNPKPLVCHPINEGDIPRTNDSILDAGFFVVSDRLNASDATACVRVGYNNWYSCAGTGDHSWDLFIPNIHYNMDRLIYDDISAFDACINEHHLKEGTKDFDFCMKIEFGALANLVVLSAVTPSVFAKSAYQSGFKHGVSDGSKVRKELD
jgi:hypothetical protein